MNSSSATPKVDEQMPDVPGILKRLVRTIAYTFYQPHHIAIFNVLLRHVIVDEDSMSLLVKIDKKQLRSMLVPLRADKLVKHRIMKEKMEDTGQYLTFTYYYMNYHLFINVIKYKLECMKRKIVHQEDSSRLRPNYTCSNCTKGFTDLDMSRLINMKTGELTCFMCHQPVHENEESKQQMMSRTLLAKFNQQFNYLYKLVDKCCTVEFDDRLIEPTILRSHVDRAILSRNSLDFNVLGMFQIDKNTNAKTRRLLANNSSYQQQLTIKFDDDESNEQGGFASMLDSKNRTKEFPEWLKHSQVDINPATSSKMASNDYRISDTFSHTNATSYNAGSNVDSFVTSNNNADQEIMDDIDELLRMEETGGAFEQSAEDPVVADSNPTSVDPFDVDDLMVMDSTTNKMLTNDDFIDLERSLLNTVDSTHSTNIVVGGRIVSFDQVTNEMLNKMTNGERAKYFGMKRNCR